jgi:hypothetical protein
MTDVIVLHSTPARNEQPRKAFVRPATVIATLVPMAIFLFIAQSVVVRGFVRADIEALISGEAWQTGGWIDQIILGAIKLLPWPAAWPTVAALMAAIAMGLLFGFLYRLLRHNGWRLLGAWLTLVVLGGNAMVLYSVSAGTRGIPFLLAVGALIPAIRAMEELGDVQSTISLGLLLPLLLLASPSLAPLILPLAVAIALADPDGRRDIRAFVAMLLVALLPTIIVAAGVVGFGAQAGLGVGGIIEPYLAAYVPGGAGDLVGNVATFLLLAPVALVPIAYCLTPGPDKKIWSALAVIALPLYMAVGRTFFAFTFPAWLPAEVLLAAFASWLAVVRLSVAMRLTALGLLFVSAITSWTIDPHFGDAEWLAALGQTARAVGRVFYLPV